MNSVSFYHVLLSQDLMAVEKGLFPSEDHPLGLEISPKSFGCVASSCRSRSGRPNHTDLRDLCLQGGVKRIRMMDPPGGSPGLGIKPRCHDGPARLAS